MTIRLLDFHFTDYFELWIGCEYDECIIEFRIEINLYKLRVSFPISWIKE